MKKYIAMALALVFCLCAFTALAEQSTIDDVSNRVSLTTGLPKDTPDTIMVSQMDNEPGARPQKGIASADVVYEIELYNGGYTRYTAVFNDTIPELIEAIRSTRIVNIDTYLEYNGVFIHYGGQQHAGSNIYEYVKTVPMGIRYDGISDGKNFYRDSSRKAPNNVICKLQQIYDKVDFSSLTMHSPLTFSEENYTSKGEDVSEFSVMYNKSYNPSYVYNADEGVYYRFYNGNEYKDGETGEQITCSNVIVHYYEYGWYNGSSERPKVTTVGRNRCDYFIGGKHFTGYWVRNSVSESTTYYDDEDNVVVFKPGKTYIQTLKDDKEVTIAE